MSDPHGHGSPTNLPFHENDWKEFQRSDRGAAAAVVVLMTAIFSMGVLIYTIVLSTVV